MFDDDFDFLDDDLRVLADEEDFMGCDYSYEPENASEYVVFRDWEGDLFAVRGDHLDEDDLWALDSQDELSVDELVNDLISREVALYGHFSKELVGRQAFPVFCCYIDEDGVIRGPYE